MSEQFQLMDSVEDALTEIRTGLKAKDNNKKAVYVVEIRRKEGEKIGSAIYGVYSSDLLAIHAVMNLIAQGLMHADKEGPILDGYELEWGLLGNGKSIGFCRTDEDFLRIIIWVEVIDADIPSEITKISGVASEIERLRAEIINC